MSTLHQTAVVSRQASGSAVTTIPASHEPSPILLHERQSLCGAIAPRREERCRAPAGRCSVSSFRWRLAQVGQCRLQLVDLVDGVLDLRLRLVDGALDGQRRPGAHVTGGRGALEAGAHPQRADVRAGEGGLHALRAAGTARCGALEEVTSGARALEGGAGTLEGTVGSRALEGSVAAGGGALEVGARAQGVRHRAASAGAGGVEGGAGTQGVRTQVACAGALE